MSAPATTSLAGIVKEFGLVDFPFAVGNFAQADALLDGPFGQALLAKLPEKGLVALGYWDLGFRNVTNSKRPITKPEDLAGIKLRVIPIRCSSTRSRRCKRTRCRCRSWSCTGRSSRAPWMARKIPSPSSCPTSSTRCRRRQRDQPRLRREHHPREQALLGPPHARRAKDDDGRGQRSARLSAAGQSRRGASAQSQSFRPRACSSTSSAHPSRPRMGQIAKTVTGRLAAGYDPAIVKLYNDELGAHSQVIAPSTRDGNRNEISRPARAEPDPVRPPRTSHLWHDHLGRDQRKTCRAGKELGVESRRCSRTTRACSSTIPRMHRLRSGALLNPADRRSMAWRCTTPSRPCRFRCWRFTCPTSLPVSRGEVTPSSRGGEGHDPGPGVAFVHRGVQSAGRACAGGEQSRET